MIQLHIDRANSLNTLQIATRVSVERKSIEKEILDLMCIAFQAVDHSIMVKNQAKPNTIPRIIDYRIGSVGRLNIGAYTLEYQLSG